MARAIPKKLADSALLRATLREVARKQSTSALIKQGYSYIQIAQALAALINAELVREEGRRLTLTRAGQNAFRGELRERSFNWIDPLDHRRVAKLKATDLYVPGRWTLRSKEPRTSS